MRVLQGASEDAGRPARQVVHRRQVQILGDNRPHEQQAARARDLRAHEVMMRRAGGWCVDVTRLERGNFLAPGHVEYNSR